MPRFESIDDVIASLQRNFRPEHAEGVDAVIQLHYTGEGGGEWYLNVHDQELDVHEGAHPEPDTTIECPADVWLDIANGKLNPMKAMMTRKLKLKGSMPVALKFQKMFGLG